MAPCRPVLLSLSPPLLHMEVGVRGGALGGVGPWVHRARLLSSTWIRRGPSGRVVRLFGVHHDLVGRRGGAGGERGGEHGALHDPIVITIVAHRAQRSG
eukprot:scaffold210067_cov26-Tisochrysis_lutea.AAC.1